ncbi:hypothetical protein YC2023_025419 [Brassica napus]
MINPLSLWPSFIAVNRLFIKRSVVSQKHVVEIQMPKNLSKPLHCLPNVLSEIRKHTETTFHFPKSLTLISRKALYFLSFSVSFPSVTPNSRKLNDEKEGQEETHGDTGTGFTARRFRSAFVPPSFHFNIQ